MKVTDIRPESDPHVPVACVELSMREAKLLVALFGNIGGYMVHPDGKGPPGKGYSIEHGELVQKCHELGVDPNLLRTQATDRLHRELSRIVDEG